MTNPYSTAHLWSKDVLAAWNDMPHQPNGNNAPATEQYRSAWKAWFERTPRALWHPAVLKAYKELDRVKR